jgi:hypothetical protein
MTPVIIFKPDSPGVDEGWTTPIELYLYLLYNHVDRQRLHFGIRIASPFGMGKVIIHHHTLGYKGLEVQANYSDTALRLLLIGLLYVEGVYEPLPADLYVRTPFFLLHIANISHSLFKFIQDRIFDRGRSF